MKDPRTSSLNKTGSKQQASSSTTAAGGLRKRKRAHHNKVKTGCFTCRKRHVKCDEGKPFCRICTKNGYKCGGYSTIDPVKVVVVPSPRTLHERDEHQAFQFFMETTMTWFSDKDGPCMSECHVNEFWNPVVVQITESEPAIKHILLAWAELHRRMLYEPVSGDEPIENDFFWQNHSQALRLLGSKKQVDTSVMLIACIMFCILERFRGRKDIFLKHLQSGLRILEHYDETPTHLRASICDSMITRYVRPILTAFRLNLSNMVDHDSLQPREKMADRLVKMEQASRALKTWN